MALFGPALALAQAAPPSSAGAQLASGATWAGLDRGMFARPPLGGGHPASPLGFPEQFRNDPMAGVAALEELAGHLSAQAESPAAVLRHVLARAYGNADRALHAQASASQAPPKFPRLRDDELARQWPAGLPADLRKSVLAFLRSVEQAEAWRLHALTGWPVNVTAEALSRRFTRDTKGSEPVEDARLDITAPRLSSALDHRALAQGMLGLMEAVEALKGRMRPSGPAQWQLDSPWGKIVIDTTSRANAYRGQQPLLLVDYGGDDTYEFDEVRAPGITVLLDLNGNDKYRSTGPGRDPSSAILGYAVLWDDAGDDQYKGHWLTQGAALAGAAALVDTRGDDRYEAEGMAQGFAWSGLALLLDGEGWDRYTAMTQSQASAAPDGIAVLLDVSGDDRYVLGNVPLVLPSAQLADRNASLGQGAGYGLRAPDRTGPTAPGGFALLVDGQGNDDYEAQVFAQGVGYEGGLGALIDGGGHDRMKAAWYSMGAAAHRASGIMIAMGDGNDSYAVSHATSLGAAHDDSTAVFVGGAGNDRYSVGTLGLGAANDGSTAMFVDRGGSDGYAHLLAPCKGFGASARSAGTDAATPADEQAPMRNAALFADLAGEDRYPGNCPDAINGRRWKSGPNAHGLGTGVDHDVAPDTSQARQP